MPRTSDARSKMIRATAQLQAEQGIPGLGLRDVVALAKAPRGSIYHHFPGGKAELTGLATAYAGDVVATVLADVVADDPEPADLVRLLGEHWARALRGSDFRAGCPVAAGALDAETASPAQQAAGEAFAHWVDIVAGHLRSRGADDERAADLAALVVSSFEGAILTARAQRSIEPIERCTRALVAALG